MTGAHTKLKGTQNFLLQTRGIYQFCSKLNPQISHLEIDNSGLFISLFLGKINIAIIKKIK